MTSTLTAESCVVRATQGHRGRTRSVAPAITSSRYLHYGRILLEAKDAPLAFQPGPLETVLVGLGGDAEVRVGAGRYPIGRYDALYVPRDAAVEVLPGAAGCDLAEIAAPVEGRYPVQHVSWAAVQQDQTLHFATGGPQNQRTVNVLVGRNVDAGRILCGVTFSVPGHWTSWPPHEHTRMLEEAYLYIDMPAPAFGIQLVYTDPARPELAVVVREGDVVLMPCGYHPNVSAPGSSINFLWMMAAHREGVDRQFGVVNVQPEYAGWGSGLEAARGRR
jgi:5-deoxy-glucuronate isomerase